MTNEVKELLQCLPPYQDKWLLIEDNQTVKDIIIEVCDAHKEFAPHYDKISSFFTDRDIKNVCDNLYTFLKKNIKYKEESEHNQTSSIPAGILTRGVGDCKHYSGFAAGVLDAMKRQGEKLNWCYRFASYKLFDSTPHHVFVVVNPGTINEIWIDPTPGADKLQPVWFTDKKVKTDMAIRRNIAGGFEEIYFEEVDNTIGLFKGKLNLSPRINSSPLIFGGQTYFPELFTQYLGLSEYRDGGKDKNVNEDDMAAKINQLIKTGPAPHQGIIGSFVEWVWYENIRSWNFFYPGGVKPGFAEIAANYLPANYPRLIITPDNRLTLDRDMKIDDYQNPYIHILTAWAQDLINREDETPYPVKPRHLKEFSQLKYGGVDTRNLFNERRGTSFIKDVGKAIEKSVNFVKDGVLKIVGSIPRNAFLGLVGLNAFAFATNLQNRINEGKWPEISKKWANLGGNPDKLKNTIADGAKKKALLGNTIGAEPATTGTAALLAAAAPIIAALIAFLDKDGKAKEVLSAAKSSLEKIFPQIDLSAFGFVDKTTGKPIEFIVDPQDDENQGGGNDDMPPMTTEISPLTLALSASAGVLAYYSFGKKNIILPAGVAVLAYMLLNKKL